MGLASDGTLVAGECTYTTREMTKSDLTALERRTAQVRWTPPEGTELTHHYCCFCRSGFSAELEAVAEDRDDLSLCTPADIVTD